MRYVCSRDNKRQHRDGEETPVCPLPRAVIEFGSAHVRLLVRRSAARIGRLPMVGVVIYDDSAAVGGVTALAAAAFSLFSLRPVTVIRVFSSELLIDDDRHQSTDDVCQLEETPDGQKYGDRNEDEEDEGCSAGTPYASDRWHEEKDGEGSENDLCEIPSKSRNHPLFFCLHFSPPFTLVEVERT